MTRGAADALVATLASDHGLPAGATLAGTVAPLAAAPSGPRPRTRVTTLALAAAAVLVVVAGLAVTARGLARLAVTLDASRVVRLTLHDVRGREVAVVVDGPLPGGRQTLTVDLTGLAAGVYVARLQTGSAARALPLTVVR